MLLIEFHFNWNLEGSDAPNLPLLMINIQIYCFRITVCSKYYVQFHITRSAHDLISHFTKYIII